MKIAFLVIAHTDADQLLNLVNRLAPNRYFDSKIFLHIDAKCRITDFENVIKNENVCLTQKRINVVRCGISQVDATMECIKAALQYEEKFDRYVVITGQDYPIVSNKEIRDKLSANFEFMRGYKVTDSSMNVKVRKYYFYNKFMSGTTAKNVFRRVVQSLFKIFSKKDYIKIGGEKWDIYYSSAYFAVSYDLLSHLYKIGTKKKYYRYFKTAICSDEMYFITIAVNSLYKEQIEIVDNSSHTLLDNSSITYFDYQNRPTVLTEKDLRKIKDSGRIFARKFDSKLSAELMVRLNDME